MIPQGTITEAFRRQYSDNFELIYQQQTSMLEGLLRNEDQEATWKSWDYVGESGVQWDRARGSETQHSSIKFARRWNKQRSVTWSPQLIDQLDVLESMKSPQSTYLQSGVASINRAKDELIIQRAFAQVIVGNDEPGTTGDIATVNYYDPGECIVMNSDGTLSSYVGDDGQTTGGVEVAKTTGATGLTLAKIQKLALNFDNASIPATDRHIVANPDQKQMLLSSTQVTSADYNTVKALTNGEINSYLGFQFHWLPTGRFPANTVETNASYPCIDCLAFHKMALLRTTGKGLTTRVDELPEHNYNVQVWAETVFGALRLQGPGVAKIVLLKHPTPTAG